jgi:DNA-binding MarR family transcriptional regulator
MSRKTHASPPDEPVHPMIGSLLRLPREHVVARMLARVNEAGFDVTQRELGVFMYPGPDGRRPSELARQCNMTRQAMNYVIAGLETRGYLTRTAGATPNATVLQMTDTGRAMYATMRDCVATVEAEWKAQLGEERFNALRATLHDLSLWLGKVD